MKERNNLFKILGIVLLAVVVLSWLIPGASFTGTAISVDEAVSPVGIWSIFSYMWDYSFFILAGLFFLMVGGFYGILNKTKVYPVLVSRVAALFKGKEFVAVVVSTLLFGVLTSLTGATVTLFVLVPFVISVILALNYNKMVAFSATVGASLMGLIAGTFGESNAVVFLKTTGIWDTSKEAFAIFKIDGFASYLTYRLILLVLVLGAFLVFVWYYNKTNKLPKKNVNKDVEDLLLEKETKTKERLWPLAVVFGLAVLVTLVGTYTWDTLGVTLFSDVHKAVTEYKVNDFAVFGNLLGTVGALGTWGVKDLMLMLAAASAILVVVYKIKWQEAFLVFAEGAKKMVPAVLIVWFVSTILLVVFQHPFYLTITNWFLDLGKGFNVPVVAILAVVNSTFFSEGLYASQFTLPAMLSVYGGAASGHAPMLALTTQVFSGLTMLIAPTSIMLMVGLYYLNITFVDWVKFIWKYLLVVVVILALVLLLAGYKVF